MKPIVIHECGDAVSMPADVILNLPQGWSVTSSQSGYVNATAWRLFADQFVSASGASEANQQFLYIDGYEAHWDEAALKFLLENHVHVMFLRSHSSITTQPNDNGVNQLWKECYSRAYAKWSREYPGSAFTGGSSDYVLQ